MITVSLCKSKFATGPYLPVIWLPAWTGNKPQELAGYYSDDCFYLDAGIPNGANGKDELLAYFRKLPDQNPD